MSSSGTKGLLGAISQHISIVENFKHCAYSTLQRNGNQPPGHHGYGRAPIQPTEGMPHAFSQWIQNIEDPHPLMVTAALNVETYQCYHKKQIQCYHCKLWGHKDSVCWDF